jgi:hypothetical protein
LEEEKDEKEGHKKRSPFGTPLFILGFISTDGRCS